MEYLKEKLIGEQLSSVEFVQDYLQLHFDGRFFIIYIWPTIMFNQLEYTYKDINYRNALCALIGKVIADIYFEDKKSLKILFQGDESFIDIDLCPYNPNIVSEIAIFNDSLDNTFCVFD